MKISERNSSLTRWAFIKKSMYWGEKLERTEANQRLMFFLYSKPKATFGVASYCFLVVLGGSSASVLIGFGGNDNPNLGPSRSRKKSLWRSFAALGVGIASQKLLGHRFFEDLQSPCHDLLLLRFSKPLVSGEIIWIPRAYCDKCGGRKLCCRFLDAISCRLEPSVKLVQALPLSAPILATF